MDPSSRQAIVEVCIDSVAGAIAAREGGAQRVELCANLLEGGTTPSYGQIKLVREAFPAPGKLMVTLGQVHTDSASYRIQPYDVQWFCVKKVEACNNQTPMLPIANAMQVLIRPRAGDFVYSPDELSVMREDVITAAKLGADGVAVGCLTRDGQVDTTATANLTQLAKAEGLDVTFHRAFDMVADQSAALQQIKAVGITRILTSGGSVSALVGAGNIARLVGEAGRHITIMAAGGVDEDNVAQVISRTGVQEVHSSAARMVFSSMQYRKTGMTLVSSKPASDYAWGCAQVDRVTGLIKAAEAAVQALPR